jgi:hypothetical protein
MTRLVTVAIAAVALSLATPAAAAPTTETAGTSLTLEYDRPLSPASQRNAVRSAQEYLDVSAFSRSGLIKQLQYEGFSTEDAIYAVDSITVDWNEQAAKSAQDYLDMSGFSRSGLINQLMYEGFTAAQAQYGAAAVGF